MTDNDDYIDSLGDAESASAGPPLLSTSWRCAACGTLQLFALPSQPSECECGGLWFETDPSEVTYLQ